MFYVNDAAEFPYIDYLIANRFESDNVNIETETGSALNFKIRKDFSHVWIYKVINRLVLSPFPRFLRIWLKL